MIDIGFFLGNGLVYGFISGFIGYFMGFVIASALNIFNMGSY